MMRVLLVCVLMAGSGALAAAQPAPVAGQMPAVAPITASVAGPVSAMQGVTALDRLARPWLAKPMSPLMEKAGYSCRRDCDWCRRDCYSRFRVHCWGPYCRENFTLCMRHCWERICRYC